MKKLFAMYAGLAIILQVFLARGYQTVAVPFCLHTYSDLFGGTRGLPDITMLLLKNTGLLYLPSILIAVGAAIGFHKRNDGLSMHSLFIGMILYLVLGVIHAVALAMPLLVTIGTLE